MNWKKIHLLLFTFCRYFLATIIILYAFAKIFETQFTSQPSIYDKPIGSLTGFQLTWYYYGYSYWYGFIIAITQITSGLLLFFRKTTRLGITIYLTFMINILLMDFAYDIEDAKGMAVTLTLMALFVFLSDYKAFFKYFVQEPLVFNQESTPNWFKKISKIKYILIPLILIGIPTVVLTLKNKYMEKNQFYGKWINEKNNDKLYFEALKTFQVVKKNENNAYIKGTYAFTKDSIFLYFNNEVTNDQQNQVYLKGKYIIKDSVMTISTKQSEVMLKQIRNY
ncbi:hypothetical protein H1R17_13000 [Flavobacterium sp. xlx-214]|uniref:hypothetical protein n=1 Tax=unclassified Flavobacterium TaxID=196869 RepID=UPI0013D69504|nr:MULTISPECIES: hypothetical protein [unclassified Flavobacterium]MBA5791492.1 hypothetical protein [Flavobacterium sp. xlx-221]QMI83358.1 hypothetical protein H1R17_13000 [Flavobacterium sp. xlx-214]